MNNKIDFKDKKQVIAFLKLKFNKRKYIKGTKLFWQLTMINNYHPEIINDILIHLEDLTCWKSYFTFLLLISNQKYKLTKLSDEEFVEMNGDTLQRNLNILENTIYNLLSTQYKKDLELYEKGSYQEVTCFNDIKLANQKDNQFISTLVKWLPSKKSAFNKKTNFIEKFIKYIFHYDSNMERKNKYNMVNDALKKIIGVCDREFYFRKINNNNETNKETNTQPINFYKMSRLSIAKHIKQIDQDTQLQITYLKYLLDKYGDYDIFKFMNTLSYNHNLDDYCKQAMDLTWNKNYIKYCDDLKTCYGIDLMIPISVNEHIMLVDLSKDIINDKTKTKLVFMMILLADKLDIEIYLIGYDSEIDLGSCANIITKYQKIISYVKPCKQNEVFSKQIVNSPCIIVSNKLETRNLIKQLFPGSVIWLLGNEKFKINKYPKFTKIEGIYKLNKKVLIDDILYKYDKMLLIDVVYKKIIIFAIIGMVIFIFLLLFFL